MAPNPLRLAVLRTAEVVDQAIARLSMRTVSAKWIVGATVRVFRAYRTNRFEGTPIYPELLVIEVSASIVDGCPELFDRDACRIIAERVADRLEVIDGGRPTIAIAFERNPAVAPGRGFQVAKDLRPSGLAGRMPTPRVHVPTVRPKTREADGRQSPGTSPPSAVIRTQQMAALDALWRLLDVHGDSAVIARETALDPTSLEASRTVRDTAADCRPAVSQEALAAALDAAMEASLRLASGVG